jgi:transposase-like protein
LTLRQNKYIIENKEHFMSQPKLFSGDQKIKLIQIINEGMQVMHEIDTLQGGLTDTVKAIAEELEVKPSTLKKAIRIAHKASLTQANQEHEDLNTILETVGKTL